MPMLTASPEMKQAAMADEPKKETTYYGHTYTTRTYFAFMNCLVQDGVLKAAFFLPDHLRLDGNNPAYEVFIDKENRQFLTYDLGEKVAGCKTGPFGMAWQELLRYLLGQRGRCGLGSRLFFRRARWRSRHSRLSKECEGRTAGTAPQADH